MTVRLSMAILRKILLSVLIVFGMASAVFGIARLLPGDPFAFRMTPGISASTLEALRHTYGLDKPLAEQYVTWLRSALSGDLGISLTTNRPVVDLIAETLPNTIILGTATLLLQFLFGISAAVASVRHPGGRIDRFVGSGTVAIYSIPNFWLGTILLVLFTFHWNLFPASQMHSVGFRRLAGLPAFLDVLWHLTLPALTFAIPGGARVARFLRGTLHDVLNEPFILNATGYGLSRARILLRYALPNALPPVISIAGVETGILLTGTLVTETLFAWPGMGRLTVSAVLARDYPLLMGTTIVSGCIVIAANLAADILHRVVNPRLRTE